MPLLRIVLPKTDLTKGAEADYEVYEEYTTDTSSVFSSPPLSPQTPRLRPHHGLHPSATMSRLLSRTKTLLPQNRSFATLSSSTSLSSARTASTLTLSRWDWKTLFYNLSFPLDQLVLGLRRGNLSNSNLSLSSDGVESDDSSKPRLRANKVMRMGSFAYRATQFFENLGKKSTSKRKVSSLSTPSDVTEYNLRDGIQEESSLSSTSTGGLAVSPSSEATSPVFEDSFRNSSTFSSPSSMEFPPLPPTPPPSVPISIKHQGLFSRLRWKRRKKFPAKNQYSASGYLNVFSSFNKRRWGQRWCLVRENMFECYRTQSSQPCELNFLLRNCVLRQALAETSSPLALMLLENNREKITVEPPSKEELSQWLRVLMMETATESVPPGLEEYFVEVDENQVEDLTAALEAEYSHIVGASVLRSWEVGSVPILPSKDKTAESAADLAEDPAADHSDKKDNPDADDAGSQEPPQAEGYLYSTVFKRPSTSTLEQLAEEADSKQEEEAATEQRDSREIPRFTDNLAVYNANKNTTDSGFYSVKEANSDSESGSDIKTDSASPTQPSSFSASPEGPAVAAGSTSGRGVSDSAGAAGGRGQVLEEEEEEESALEKTMTSEDFKDNLEGEKTVTSETVQSHSDGGKDVLCSASSAVSAEPDGEENHGCENSVHAADPDRGVTVPASKDTHSAGGSVNRESHVHSEKSSEDLQPRDKAKKKKKKGKNKKGRPKQQEQEHTQSGQSAVDNVTSNPKSQSEPTTHNPGATGVPVCRASGVERGAEGAQSPPNKDLVSGDKPLYSGVWETSTCSPDDSSGVCESSNSAPSPGAGVEGRKEKGPEDDEGIVELKERIGKLREKLVQIKRKRIAVRDKRVRAFSAEERTLCDKEYLVLESECKETAAIILNLEEELKASSLSAAYPS